MQQVNLATFGIWELILILAIVLVIFGAGKLPQLGESLGKGIRNFRRSFKDSPREVEGEAKRVETSTPEQLSAAKQALPEQPVQEKVESTNENG
jgi:sec-independent protein translocase protein TatA